MPAGGPAGKGGDAKDGRGVTKKNQDKATEQLAKAIDQDNPVAVDLYFDNDRKKQVARAFYC